MQIHKGMAYTQQGKRRSNSPQGLPTCSSRAGRRTRRRNKPMETKADLAQQAREHPMTWVFTEAAGNGGCVRSGKTPDTDVMLLSCLFCQPS